MPLISVIIPVYKVEDCLRQCLDSVLSQTLTDYECILVDDGSPDNCPAICDEYAEKDPRLKVIHKKENEGLPLARKSGLDMAVSDLVFHIDSDDWVEPDALELLYKRQKETGAAIVVGNFREISAVGIKNRYFAPIKEYENPVVWFLLCEHKFLWGKLYKRELYDDYVVPQTNIFEDAIVNVQLFLKLAYSQVQFVDTFLYNYNTKNSDSLIAQLRLKRYNSYAEHPMINAYQCIYDLLKNLMQGDNYLYSAYLFSFLNVGVTCYLKGYCEIKRSEFLYFYENYYKKCSYIHFMRIDGRLFIFVCNISVVLGKLFVFIYNVAFRLRNFIYRKYLGVV